MRSHRQNPLNRACSLSTIPWPQIPAKYLTNTLSTTQSHLETWTWLTSWATTVLPCYLLPNTCRAPAREGDSITTIWSLSGTLTRWVSGRPWASGPWLDKIPLCRFVSWCQRHWLPTSSLFSSLVGEWVYIRLHKAYRRLVPCFPWRLVLWNCLYTRALPFRLQTSSHMSSSSVKPAFRSPCRDTGRILPYS